MSFWQGDCSFEPGSGEDRSERGNRCRRPLWMLLWAHNQWVLCNKSLSWLLDHGPKYNTWLSTVADNYGLAAYGLYLFLLTIWWSMVIKILIETINNKNWLYEIVNTTNEPLNRNGATQLPALTTTLKSVSKETWAGGKLTIIAISKRALEKITNAKVAVQIMTIAKIHLLLFSFGWGPL